MSGSLRPKICAVSLISLLLASACASEPADTTDTTMQAASTSTSSTGASTSSTTTDPTGAPTSGGDTVDDGTTAAACGAGGIDDCCCFEVRGAADHPILSIVCVAGETPCMAPQAQCPDAQTQCGVADLTVTSAEGLDCALAALASGKPGLVSWGITASDGIHGSTHNLFMQPGGAAFVSTYTYDDMNYTYSAVERRALQPASFFTDCLAKADNARFDCLESASVGPATETCVDGFKGAIGR